VVAGFPANDFGAQEPGSNEEIAEFCTTNFGVKFPMYAKITVTGEAKHPLYAALTSAAPKASSMAISAFGTGYLLTDTRFGRTTNSSMPRY